MVCCVCTRGRERVPPPPPQCACVVVVCVCVCERESVCGQRSEPDKVFQIAATLCFRLRTTACFWCLYPRLALLRRHPPRRLHGCAVCVCAPALRAITTTDASTPTPPPTTHPPPTPKQRLACENSYLVDPASSHMLVSKIKPCMSKYKPLCTVKLRMAHYISYGLFDDTLPLG